MGDGDANIAATSAISYCFSEQISADPILVRTWVLKQWHIQGRKSERSMAVGRHTYMHMHSACLVHVSDL